jgi:riboflavin synthase
MFTGLVESTASVLSLEEKGQSARLLLHSPTLAPQVALGDSIAINGCCLTVAAIDLPAATLAFDLLAQTLRVTSLGDLAPGSLVNLERAIQIGDRFGGHFVQGHVDATVTVLEWLPQGQDHQLTVSLPPEHRGLVIPKGSVCLDGISLTAAEVTPDSVTCWIIPHTIQMTHLKSLTPGRRLNIEFDMLGKYVQNLLAARS